LRSLKRGLRIVECSLGRGNSRFSVSDVRLKLRCLLDQTGQFGNACIKLIDTLRKFRPRPTRFEERIAFLFRGGIVLVSQGADASLLSYKIFGIVEFLGITALSKEGVQCSVSSLKIRLRTR